MIGLMIFVHSYFWIGVAVGFCFMAGVIVIVGTMASGRKGSGPPPRRRRDS